MRPKVVFLILLIACGIVGMAVYLSNAPRVEPDAAAPQTVTNPLPVKMPVAVAFIPPPPVTNASSIAPNTNTAVYVQERNAELMALAMNNDAASFNTIWSELSNPDKEIRAGALAAVVQFGDRSVAPRLRDLAAKTGDAEEKVAILDAANFLELPPLTQLHNPPPTNAPQ